MTFQYIIRLKVANNDSYVADNVEAEDIKSAVALIKEQFKNDEIIDINITETREL
jgi:hypothetical protein